jgi:hypothetical protein
MKDWVMIGSLRKKNPNFDRRRIAKLLGILRTTLRTDLVSEQHPKSYWPSTVNTVIHSF